MGSFRELCLVMMVCCFSQSLFAQNQWDIQLSLQTVDCATNQACYALELRSASGTDWTLGDQNYRLFFDGDLTTVTSVSSLLPGAFYGPAVIDQNLKIAGQGQEAFSPLNDIDDNLGFLDFNITQTDKSNPGAAQLITTASFTQVAEICVDVDPAVINDENGTTCLAFYHSRPETAGSLTTQYTVVSENDTPNNVIASTGAGYDDLTEADGQAACLGAFCAAGTNSWNIRFNLADVDCFANTACYNLELQSSSGSDWALGDQNYRIFFDGDLSTVTSVTSLLPGAFYGPATIDQNVKVSGQGQEAASPLDDIDDNLGFLDFSIVQSDKTNPAAAQQIITADFVAVAEICVSVEPEVINNVDGNTCLAFYHSRPATAGSVTEQYTVVSENDVPNNTVSAAGLNYDDLTAADGNGACLGAACVQSWDIQLTQSLVNCADKTACYTLELQSASGMDWALGDQNYRFFFDADIMTVTSVTSLLDGAYYGAANIDQNLAVSGQGQEAFSPLDDIDDNLGFLDFSIVQTDKSNPAAAQQILTSGFTGVAEICVSFVPEVLTDETGTNCLTFYHSRPATAGAFTGQYTVISENNGPNSTNLTSGATYNDVVDDCLDAACPDCLEIDLRVYLEGSLIIPQTGLYQVPMRTDLNSSKLLPGQYSENAFSGNIYTPALGTPGQAYNISPWNYSGNEGTFFDSEAMSANADAGYPATVTDWILVSLRSNPTDGSEILCQRAALLHQDGSVQFVDEDYCCELDPGQPYYIVVEHRNHLIIMSAESIPVINGFLTYDFTDKQSYLNDPFNSGVFVRQKEVVPGVFAMIAGNGEQSSPDNEDTDITAADFAKWLLNGPETRTYNLVDYNMDGEVSALDYELWETNSPLFTSVLRD